MPTQIEYALFAANVYGSKDRDYVGPEAQIRHPNNDLPVPDGWAKLGHPTIEDNHGFMAQAYRRGNEIVISYAGTTYESPLTAIATIANNARARARVRACMGHACTCTCTCMGSGLYSVALTSHPEARRHVPPPAHRVP